MNSIFNTYKNLADKILPIMTKNDFSRTGMLTPNEFVKAGNYLVNKYPSWKWNNVPKNKQVSYLPKDKQMIRIINNFKKRKILVESELDNWMLFDKAPKTKQTKQIRKIKEIKKTETTNKIMENTKTKNAEKFDLSDLEDSDLEDSDLEDNIILIMEKPKIHKKYDITLTYDNYYRTPRIWFNIYDNNIPIKDNEILEYLSIEHNTTVTMKQHPFFNMIYVSVHPCRHSEVMKKLIRIELEQDKKINVEKYFIFFLKFVSCVIPQIDFDFTI